LSDDPQTVIIRCLRAATARGIDAAILLRLLSVGNNRILSSIRKGSRNVMKPSTTRSSRFLHVCRGEETDATPFMLSGSPSLGDFDIAPTSQLWPSREELRQADAIAERTLGLLEHFDLDAVTLTVDPLAVLDGMGVEIVYPSDAAPVVGTAITTTRDVDLLATPPADITLGGAFDAARGLADSLASRRAALLGYSVSPFALACEAIERRASRAAAKTKGFMYAEPAAWKRLMDKLVTVIADSLHKQAEAGVHALQIHDPRAGQALGLHDYLRFVKPYDDRLFSALSRANVPLLFVTSGSYGYFEDMASCGATAFGVDWRTPLRSAAHAAGPERMIMGNLDPAVIDAPWRELQAHADLVLEDAERIGPHVFSPGGELPHGTAVDSVSRLIDYVHERTAR